MNEINKTIGILTLWESSDNYGQQLQCWALQRELVKLGQSPYLIRYDTSLKIGGKAKLLHNLKRLIKFFLTHIIMSKNRLKVTNDQVQEYNTKNEIRKFKEFRDSNIIQSQAFYKNIKELRKQPPKADIYIVGSDQVWSYPLSYEESKAYFLDFGPSNVKRIAYAASFSLPSYPENLKRILKKLLEKFDAISVREKTGVNICRDIGVEAQLVLDPTLLLSKNDYLSLARRNDANTQPFIYVYHLNINSEEDLKVKEIKALIHNERLLIKATTSSGQIVGKELLDFAKYEYCTIPQWINNIENAEFVITTSFHGVAFCLLMHTNFIWIPLIGRSGRGNSRVEDLLTILALEDHIYSDNVSIQSAYDSEIDWSLIDSKLKNIRNTSIKFIRTSIGL